MTADSGDEPRRRLAIDLSELDFAFESGSTGVEFYLDLETGEFISFTEETRSAFEAMDEDEGDSEKPDLPDWLQEEVERAAAVESGFGTRYISVPADESNEAYRDMEDFVETVEDRRLQLRLSDAIRGRGAFRRFKDVLLGSPRERDAWFAFQNARVRRRVLDWLDSEGIDPVS
jgi:hypothetical protein